MTPSECFDYDSQIIARYEVEALIYGKNSVAFSLIRRKAKHIKEHDDSGTGE